jgi:hypothetical protein
VVVVICTRAHVGEVSAAVNHGAMERDSSQSSLQEIVTDRLRPTGKNDAFGVELARTQLQTACVMIDQDMATKIWAMDSA